MSIAFVQAMWHEPIVNRARDSFTAEWRDLSGSVTDISFFAVPGAFEIPLCAQRLARMGQFRAIVAVGFVPDGGIYRNDFVSASVIDGLMHVQLEADVPVLSGVLTPHHFHDHDDHAEFFGAHFDKKGRELAQACARTLATLDSIDEHSRPVP